VIVGHQANAMAFFCGTVLWTSPQGPANDQEITSAADTVEGLKASFADCEKAYAIDDEVTMEKVEVFGTNGPAVRTSPFETLLGFFASYSM
jgi:hypothetical protein